jgi:beta-N-acetylhexosaminidase
LPDEFEVSLHRRIAQMLIVGFRGTELNGNKPFVRDLRECRIDGVILVDYDDLLKSYESDITSPQQLIQLTAFCVKSSVSTV